MNCHLRDKVTILENMKNGQIPKNRKNWNLSVSKPENHNLSRKTAIKIDCEFSRKKKFSFSADTLLKFDQIKRKMEAKFNKPFFVYKSFVFKSRNDHNFQAIN